MTQRPLVYAEVMQMLRAAARSLDTESAHVDADDALCKLLDALGYTDVVEHYRIIEKWYA